MAKGLSQCPSMDHPVSFSVVTPLYNKRAFIGRTLASVLDQTHPAHEVIVVDDGSTDEGAAIVEQLGDPRVRVVYQDNRGEGPARNRGFAEASGPWVALVDADDLWRRDHLATLAVLIGTFPDVDAVGCGWCEVKDDATVHLDALDGPVSRPRMIDFFREHAPVFSTSSIAIRRTAFARTTGFGKFGLGCDSEFWVRFALDHRIAVSDRQTSLYVRGTGGAMERAQAGMAAGAPVPESPVLATLDAVLRSHRHADRHAVIRAYADRLRLQYARSLVYHGRAREARGMLAGVRGRTPALTALRLLAHAPGPLLRTTARGYSSARRMLSVWQGLAGFAPYPVTQSEPAADPDGTIAA